MLFSWGRWVLFQDIRKVKDTIPDDLSVVAASQYAGRNLAVADVDLFSWGRWVLFQDIRKVKDTIPDDLFQWLQPANTRGGMRLVTDRACRSGYVDKYDLDRIRYYSDTRFALGK